MVTQGTTFCLIVKFTHCPDRVLGSTHVCSYPLARTFRAQSTNSEDAAVHTEISSCCSHLREQSGLCAVCDSCETRNPLLDLVLEVLARNEVGDLVIISLLLALLHVLVALGELAERRQRVGSKLVKNARDELGKLLVLSVTVNGECVRRHSGVN